MNLDDGTLDDGERSKPGRRDLIRNALLGAAGGAFAANTLQAAEAADDRAGEIRKIGLRPPGAPSADSGYTPAILAAGGQLLFISGQGPEDVTADMETQVRQTFDRIGLLLEAAGGSFANVVILRSYWVHLLRDLAIYRKVRKDYLVKPYPASTAVGTPELAIPGLELEIEAVAVIT